MYYFVYGLLYLMSLLPWWLLYIISDGIYLLVYYVIRYRRDIVLANLQIAFPVKTKTEHIKISKQFYHNLIDNFVEMIKLLSITKKQLDKRFITNIEVVNDLFKTGKNVQIHSGHFFNWEFAHLATSANLQQPFLGVYLPVKNKAVNRILLKLRSRFGAILIPATKFRSQFHKYGKQTYALGFIADQNAGHTGQAFWAHFFNKLTPFVKGPEKGAQSLNCSVVFCNFYNIKRGYFRMEFSLLTTNPKEMKEGEITKRFISFLEDCIREHPSNYLWSHRRWKWQFDEKKHGHLVI